MKLVDLAPPRLQRPQPLSAIPDALLALELSLARRTVSLGHLFLFVKFRQR